MRRVAPALVVAAAFLAQPAQAQVYRWVDDQGVIHLSSEKPPPGVKSERLDIGGTSKRWSRWFGGRASSNFPPWELEPGCTY